MEFLFLREARHQVQSDAPSHSRPDKTRPDKRDKGQKAPWWTAPMRRPGAYLRPDARHPAPIPPRFVSQLVLWPIISSSSLCRRHPSWCWARVRVAFGEILVSEATSPSRKKRYRNKWHTAETGTCVVNRSEFERNGVWNNIPFLRKPTNLDLRTGLHYTYM